MSARQSVEPAWVAFDRRHVWHPFTQMATAPCPIPIERADGIYLQTTDGRRIIDGISSWWVNIHGHNHPRLNRALAEQANKFAQVIFAGMTHEPAARLAAALVARAPAGLERVFFSDDGSTAVEVAMKMAYQSWQQRGEPQRTRFVALEHAYHGDTFGAMAVGARSVFHERFAPLLFDVTSVPAPYCLHCPAGKRRDTCRIDCADALERLLERLLERDGQSVAAVIIEPMLQGAGGMLVWPPAFLRRVRKLTREHGVLLIADEVFTGFGRTGKMFACEHGPIMPDLLCLSKALTGGYMPLAATLATPAIYEAFLGAERALALLHGHSYTGNALACAVALESLALFDDERRLDRVRELEQLFDARLETIARLPIVAETRHIGALAAVELRRESPGHTGAYLDMRGPTLAAFCLERGLLLRPLGNVLYFLPPYVITDTEAHRCLDIIHAALQQLAS